MIGHSRAGAALAALLVVAACAPTQVPKPQPSTRTVASTPGTAKARLIERLVELGFAVTGQDSIRARDTAADPAWADCSGVRVEDPSTDFSRKNWTHPQARSAVVDAWARPSPDGTLVHLVARHAAAYRNIYINLPFSRPCTTTGVLERQLLDAAG